MSMWRAVVPHPSCTRGAAVPPCRQICQRAPGLTQWELDHFASRSRLRFMPVCRGVMPWRALLDYLIKRRHTRGREEPGLRVIP